MIRWFQLCWYFVELFYVALRLVYIELLQNLRVLAVYSQQIDTRLVGGKDALPGIASCFKGRLSCLGFIRCSENDVI